jgi:hypothetical protein
MSNEKKRSEQESVVKVFDPGTGPHPFRGLTRAAALDTIVNPPDYAGGDRTKEDRDRHKDRIRDQIRPKLPEIVGGNPIFGDKGKIKVPVQGGYEPRWRYGRDGGGGGAGGKKGGNQPGDLIYVEITLEELIQMLFEEMELPDLLKKQLSTTKVKAYKFRGTQQAGPKPRLKKGDTARARIRRAIGMRNANPEAYLDEEEILEAFEDNVEAAIEGEVKPADKKNKKFSKKIPTTKQVPFAKKDRRYHRVEETLDDDSKCVVFFVLDRSGSMGGDPLMLAKSFFLLNLLFLRTKYKDVRVVMIAHDAQAYRIDDERKFYQIEVDGGTMFVPAYEMVCEIAEKEFPISVWNRYMFQATDGYAFDGDQEIRDWMTKILGRGPNQLQFNYVGYLEIDPAGWNGSDRWANAGQALLSLPAPIRAHLGMGKVRDLKGIPDAFKQILTKDKRKEA